MKPMTDLTVLFLHRMVCKRLDQVIGSMNRCERSIVHGADRYESLAVLQAECKELTALRDELIEEIALRNLLKDFD